MGEKQDDRRVRKTKKQLRQALATLLTQKNIKDISVRELTELADLHRGTFYLHYRDIYDLQAQIEAEMLAEFSGILAQFPPAKGPVLPLLLAVFQYLADNAEMCRMLLSENGDISFLNQLTSIVHDKCLHDWMELYRGGDPETFRCFSAFLVAGCVGVLRHWLDEGMRTPPETVAAMIEQVALRGIGSLQ